MKAEQLPQKQYVNFVHAVAILNGCRLTDIDLPNHLIRLEGAPEDVAACCGELSSVLGNASPCLF